MADDTDFSSLLESPIDDSPRERRSWDAWPIIAGIAVAALAVTGGYLVASSAGESTPTTIAAPETTTTTTTAQTGENVAFPPGYAELDDMTAVAPQYIVSGGGEVFVSFATAVRRGFESTGDEFSGGTWTLEMDDGTTLESSDTVFATSVPGSFSAKFTGTDDAQPAQITLNDQWRRDHRWSDTEAPFAGLPYDLAEPILVDLGAGTTLSIDSLHLEEDSGSLEWSLHGTGNGGMVGATVVAGHPEQPEGAWYSEGGFAFLGFGSGPPLDPQMSGTLTLRSGETLDDSADVPFLTIQINTTLATSLPVDATWELAEVPNADL
ncbi:MAG: hypothetical protein ABFR89_05920 [Actinomycetota bacterium]